MRGTRDFKAVFIGSHRCLLFCLAKGEGGLTSNGDFMHLRGSAATSTSPGILQPYQALLYVAGVDIQALVSRIYPSCVYYNFSA